jgi:hypothetical protein
MVRDKTTYYVFHEDETRATGSLAGSYIPTIGAPASAIDQYRTFGIHETNLNTLSVALTDVGAVTAVSKIAEGGFTSYREIEAAETALQALLLYDVVHVITYGPKVEYDTGLISYLRTDSGLRTKFGFDLFRLAHSRDWIIAPEYASSQDSRLITSCLAINPNIEDIKDRKVPYWSTKVGDAVNATLQDHGIPAYLTDSALIKTRRGEGFAKRFYHRMRISWDAATGDIPPIVCPLRLPPLLAIVFDRLTNREDLETLIKGLREELAPVRTELHSLNEIVTSSTTQADIDKQIALIDQSFDSIIDESRLTKAERRQRNIMRIHRLARPILKFMAAVAGARGVSEQDILKATRNINHVLESRSIIDRTITGKTFSDLLKTEALQSLLKHHLTSSELKSIEKSLGGKN